MKVDNVNHYVNKKKDVIYGENDASYGDYFPHIKCGPTKQFYKKISINDISYKIGTTIVANAYLNEIEFGKIKAIFEEKN